MYLDLIASIPGPSVLTLHCTCKNGSAMTTDSGGNWQGFYPMTIPFELFAKMMDEKSKSQTFLSPAVV